MNKSIERDGLYGAYHAYATGLTMKFQNNDEFPWVHMTKQP